MEGILDETINFTSIDEYFRCSIKNAEDKEIFRENLLKNILIDYEDALDEKLNKFIKLVLETYPIIFFDSKETKTEKNIHNLFNKAKSQDRVLKELFLSEISDGDFIAAADTLYKKNFYTNNQNCPALETWDYWINTEISVSDMSKLLGEDIINYNQHKKVRTKALKKYLKQEILLRISDLNLHKKEYTNIDEYVNYVTKEKKLITEKILLAFEDGQDPEKLWNSY